MGTLFSKPLFLIVYFLCLLAAKTRRSPNPSVRKTLWILCSWILLLKFPAPLLPQSDLETEDSKKAKFDTGSGLGAVVSPSSQWFVFTMTKGHEIVSGSDEATVFEENWGSFILKKHTFGNEADAQNFSRTLTPSPPTTPLKSVVDVDAPVISSDVSARLSEACAMLQGRKPTNRINIHYRTNCASHNCVVVIECLNYSGKPQWNVKPDILCDPLQLFPKQFSDDPDAAIVISDTAVGECFFNITKMVIRDVSSGPDSPLQIKWVSPDKSREITYDQYVMATHFTIPVDQLSSVEEEQRFIVSKLSLFGGALKKVMASPVFARLHEANCPKESIWKSMNGNGPKTGGVSFLDYVKDASVTVSKCDNLNCFVTRVEADKLMGILWDGRKPGCTSKY